MYSNTLLPLIIVQFVVHLKAENFCDTIPKINPDYNSKHVSSQSAWNSIKKLNYSSTEQNLVYNISDLIEIFFEKNLNKHKADDKTEGIFVLSSIATELGIWQYSLNEGNTWETISVTVNEDIFKVLQVPSWHIGPFDVRKACEDLCDVSVRARKKCKEKFHSSSLSGTYIPSSQYLRFLPKKNFWSVFDSERKTRLIFTVVPEQPTHVITRDLTLNFEGHADDFIEILEDKSILLSEEYALLANFAIIRADWIDCSEEPAPLPINPKTLDDCGVCGGDGSSCKSYSEGSVLYTGQCITSSINQESKESVIISESISVPLDFYPECPQHSIAESEQEQFINLDIAENISDKDENNIPRLRIVANEDVEELDEAFDNRKDDHGTETDTYNESIDYGIENDDGNDSPMEFQYNWTESLQIHKRPQSQIDNIKAWDNARQGVGKIEDPTTHLKFPGLTPRYFRRSVVQTGYNEKSFQSRYSETKEKHKIGFNVISSIIIRGPENVYSDSEVLLEVQPFTCELKRIHLISMWKYYWHVNGTLQGRKDVVQQNSKLRIPKYIMKPFDVYNVTVFVEIESIPGKIFTASKTMNVLSRGVKAFIPVKHVTMYEKSTLVLDASASKDLSDLNKPLQFLWQCWTPEKHSCYVKARKHSIETVESYLGNATISEKYLKLPSELLKPGSYIWSVTVMNENEGDCYSTNVVVLPEEQSHLQVMISSTEDENDVIHGDKVDSLGIIKINSRVIGALAGTTVTWEKVCIEKNTTAIETELIQKTELSEDSIDFQFPLVLHNALKPNTKYTFRLKATHFLSKPVIAETEITTKGPPIEGGFIVEPKEGGVALKTLFTFSIDSRFDRLFTYRLGFILPTDDSTPLEQQEIHWLQTHSIAVNFVQDFLPACKSLVAVAKVCGEIKPCTTFFHPVKVNFPSESYSWTELKLLRKILKTKMAETDITAALTYVYSVFSTMESADRGLQSKVYMMFEENLKILVSLVSKRLASVELEEKLEIFKEITAVSEVIPMKILPTNDTLQLKKNLMQLISIHPLLKRNLEEENNVIHVNYPKNLIQIRTKRAQKENRPKRLLNVEEIRELLHKSENAIATATGENEVDAKENILTDVHNYAVDLCKFVRNSSRDEETISGKYVKIHIAFMTDKLKHGGSDLELETEGLKHNSKLKIEFGHTLKKYCSEYDAGTRKVCYELCYGAVYFTEDFHKQNHQDSEFAMWETMVINPKESKVIVSKFKNISRPITLEFNMHEIPLNHTAECGIWNPDLKDWNTSACETAIVNRLSGRVLQCFCRHFGYFKPLKIVTSTYDALESQVLEYKEVTFIIDTSYNETVGTHKEIFEAYLTKQLAKQLGISVHQIADLEVKPGSVLVILKLVNNTDPSNQSARSIDEMFEMLDRKLVTGKLTLIDLTNKPMKIAKQNLSQRREQIQLNMILGAVIGSVLAVGAMAFAIMSFRKYRKQKEDSVRPIKGVLGLETHSDVQRFDTPPYHFPDSASTRETSTRASARNLSAHSYDGIKSRTDSGVSLSHPINSPRASRDECYSPSYYSMDERPDTGDGDGDDGSLPPIRSAPSNYSIASFPNSTIH